MDRLLIVEDSKSMAAAVSECVRQNLGYPFDVVRTYAQAQQIFRQRGGEYFLALVEPNLMDAPDGQIVDLAASKGAPSIVFSADFGVTERRLLEKRKIVDYVVKRPENLKPLMGLIRRIHNNRGCKALVVDDSSYFRNMLVHILSKQRLSVLEACNGENALELFSKHPDIKLVITDYKMPVMDGYELTLALRRHYAFDELAIIGISSDEQKQTLPMFLKSGANDFLQKGASTEEIVCRVNMNLDLLEFMDETRKLANCDPLTGLFNRRCFFEKAEPVWAQAKRSGRMLCAAMADIDHFKRINDTYGHHVGDLVIKALADLLARSFPEPDIVSRFGGEEYCLLSASIEPVDLYHAFEGLRQSIQDLAVRHEGVEVSFTASIGVCVSCKGGLAEMIRTADRMLYMAKRAGRNTIRISG
ncbi:MAG: diguanylate cyclase [Desulfovibrionaceae bacterium]|jgi:diguanylate cyclase (GGDEF)-like protein